MGASERAQPAEELTPFVVVSTAEGLRVVELEAGRMLRVGSSPSADIVATGQGVLPEHLTLFWLDDGVSLACAPGAEVFIGGKPAEPTQALEPGEDVVVGDTQLVLGIPSPIEFRPLPNDDPTQRQPDIGRAKELLGWNPEVTLIDGLHRYADWLSAQTA